jgi:hypothetical protein
MSQNLAAISNRETTAHHFAWAALLVKLRDGAAGCTPVARAGLQVETRNGRDILGYERQRRWFNIDHFGRHQEEARLNKGLFAWFRRKGPAQTADETSRAVGRRGVLRATAAALAAAGGAALIGKGATPAQAANGDTITVGNTFSGTATTELDVTGAPVGFKVTNNLAFTGIQGTSASGDGVSGNSTSGIGLVGRSSGGMGVFGSTDSSTNFGVMGTNFSGPGIAGFGADASATAPISGVGVGAWGVSSSAAAGVEGDNSTSGPGVFGGNTGSGVGVAGFGGAANATAPVSGSGVGVWGVSTAGAAGVEGNNVSGGPGVYGVSIRGGHGVLGSSTGSAFAVYGTNSNTGTGVYGDSQGGMGLWGVTNSSGQGIASPAVAGSNIAGGTAIAGFTDGPNSIGTAGASNSGLGVYGSSQSSVGVLGYTKYGLRGCWSGERPQRLRRVLRRLGLCNRSLNSAGREVSSGEHPGRLEAAVQR